MYSSHNEGEFAFAEKFIRPLRKKIYEHMTSISKNVYIDKLDDIVNKYNNIYHSTIKMKPVDVKSSTYIDFSNEVNDKNPKFKIGTTVTILKYKKQKAMLQIGLKKFLLLQKLKMLFRGHMLLVILKAKKLLELFFEKELRKTNKKEFRVEKVIKRKGDKLYIKWKGYHSSFNSWIDKKDIV